MNWLATILAALIAGIAKWLVTDDKSFTPTVKDSQPHDDLKERLRARIAGHRAERLRRKQDDDLRQ